MLRMVNQNLIRNVRNKVRDAEIEYLIKEFQNPEDKRQGREVRIYSNQF